MIVIIDYGVGNLMSVHNILKRIGHSSIISGSEKDILEASKFIFPGMGHFDNCMKKLRESGLLPSIEHKVLEEKTPILGICVGLQMLMEYSEEGVEPGLKWVKGHTKKIDTSLMSTKLSIPHMGWETLSMEKQSPLFDNLKDSRFYFAHSYHVKCEQNDSIATVNYGYDFTVAVQKDNISGVQFHPEKSHRFGMQLFKNYVEKI